MLPNPQGPSYNSSYCPTKMPLGQFFNNSAHSSGRFGLWVIYLFYYHSRKILKDFLNLKILKGIPSIYAYCIWSMLGYKA